MWTVAGVAIVVVVLVVVGRASSALLHAVPASANTVASVATRARCMQRVYERESVISGAHRDDTA
jgi:hypothetical protein